METLAGGAGRAWGFPFLSFGPKDLAACLVRRQAFAYPVRWTGE